MLKKNKIAEIIATFFYSGKSKFAPGTVGSFCSLPLVAVVYPLGFIGLWSVTVLVYLLGIWATAEVLKTSEDKDIIDNKTFNLNILIKAMVPNANASTNIMVPIPNVSLIICKSLV